MEKLPAIKLVSDALKKSAANDKRIIQEKIQDGTILDPIRKASRNYIDAHERDGERRIRDFWIRRGEGLTSFPPPDIDNMTTDQIKRRVLILEDTFKGEFEEDED